MTQSSPDIAALAHRIETTPVDGKFQTRLFAMSDAERDLVVRLLRSQCSAGSEEYPDAPMVCAELYQVIASLAFHFGVMEHPDVQKALDNASQHKLVHVDLLPWPKQDLPDLAQPSAGSAQPKSMWQRPEYDPELSLLEAVHDLAQPSAGIASAIDTARQSLIAAAVGSCTCNTKSPNMAYHDASCRALKIASALDDLDTIASLQPSSAGSASPVAYRWRWKGVAENNPWRLVHDASGISQITAEIEPLYGDVAQREQQPIVTENELGLEIDHSADRYQIARQILELFDVRRKAPSLPSTEGK